MDKQTAIDKIRKCLALGKSSEPHEAAAALRQAQKLMEQFGIDQPELMAAGVSEGWAKSGATKTPTRYEVMLASTIASAFSCGLVFCRRLTKTASGIEGGYAFIGAEPAPDVATYTYTVLRRYLIKARSAYIKTALKRYSKNRTAAADMFCEGWIVAVRGLIVAVAPTAEQSRAIDAYMRINHAKTSVLTPREVTHGKNVSTHDHKYSGYVAGKSVSLNKGVSSGATVARLLG